MSYGSSCAVCLAGELVVDQLLSKYGPKRSAWPKKLLKNLEERNAALSGAIIERVGFVPKELFWPLGLSAKELITSREGGGKLRSARLPWTACACGVLGSIAREAMQTPVVLLASLLCRLWTHNVHCAHGCCSLFELTVCCHCTAFYRG